MDVKKQMRVGDRKISFFWDEDAGTWHMFGEAARHEAADLDHARTMVRVLELAGVLYHSGQDSESAEAECTAAAGPQGSLPDARLDSRDADLRDWPDEELNVGGYVGTLKDMGTDETRVRIVRVDGSELAPLAIRVRPDGDVELVVMT